MQTTITITDPDRRLDFRLDVACDYFPPRSPRWGWRHGGEPGETARVEVSRVRCLEIVVWCGKWGVSAIPATEERRSLESRIGDWCLEHYPDEIERAVLDAVDAPVGAAGF